MSSSSRNTGPGRTVMTAWKPSMKCVLCSIAGITVIHGVVYLGANLSNDLKVLSDPLLPTGGMCVMLGITYLIVYKYYSAFNINLIETNNCDFCKKLYSTREQTTMNSDKTEVDSDQTSDVREIKTAHLGELGKQLWKIVERCGERITPTETSNTLNQNMD